MMLRHVLVLLVPVLCARAMRVHKRCACRCCRAVVHVLCVRRRAVRVRVRVQMLVLVVLVRVLVQYSLHGCGCALVCTVGAGAMRARVVQHCSGT